MEDDNSYIPKIKKNITSYLTEERGEISRHHMMALGAFLSTISFLNFVPEVEAGHTNGFGMDWTSGTISPSHSHHVSSVL